MTILAGRIAAASVYGLAVVILVLYVLVTRQKFFFSLAFPLAYMCIANVVMATSSGAELPPQKVVTIWFQPALILLGLTIAILFGIRLWMYLRGRNGFSRD